MATKSLKDGDPPTSSLFDYMWCILVVPWKYAALGTIFRFIEYEQKIFSL